jgi:hypothetical protein
MKFRIRSLLIALLLSSTSSGFACGARAVNTGDADIPPRQEDSRQDDLTPAGRDFSSEGFRGRMRLVRVGPAAFCLVAIWKQTAPPAELEPFFNFAEVAAR